MLEPVINSSYCLTISLKYIYVLMDFYYFAFVHYILITIRRPPGRETLNKKKGYGIDQENMATNRNLEQDK